ncbi:MAG: hypothetical protein ACLVEV_03825 [Lachnospiraceae bacterium]|uniref:hypothetical protein n=1 Tax=Parablautia sp. Marseille-Q6255 TaxID=3039593 RepID=UPI0024BD08EE|nr:hypothetical protein [Parablautia sp. Marseille-Q6255]
MRRDNKVQTYNDGNCTFFLIDEEGNAGSAKETLRFEERTVGVQRFYESMTKKFQVDRVLRVPLRPWLTTEYLAVVDGEVYEIEQVQTIRSLEPKSNDVALHRARQRRVADGTI